MKHNKNFACYYVSPEASVSLGGGGLGVGILLSNLSTFDIGLISWITRDRIYTDKIKTI